MPLPFSRPVECMYAVRRSGGGAVMRQGPSKVCGLEGIEGKWDRGELVGVPARED